MRFITMTVGGVYGSTYDHKDLTVELAVQQATLAGYVVLDVTDTLDDEYDAILVVSDS
jgi:hypothetical protein